MSSPRHGAHWTRTTTTPPPDNLMVSLGETAENEKPAPLPLPGPIEGPIAPPAPEAAAPESAPESARVAPPKAANQ